MNADKLKDKFPLIDKLSSNKYISFQDDTDVDEENDDIIIKAFSIDQDIDAWAKFHKSSGKEIFEIQDADEDALLLVASIFSQDWTERFLAEKFGEDVILKERKDACEDIFIKPAKRILSEDEEKREKKVTKEILKAPVEVEEREQRVPDIPKEKVDIAKEATSELRELLEGVEKLADQIKSDEKDAQTRMEEFLQARGTEGARRKLQSDMDRLTTMLKAAGDVVKINAKKVLGLIEKTNIEPILSKAVKDKVKEMNDEHKKLVAEYESRAGAQMAELKQTITQRIVEFPIKPEILKGSKQAFLKDILKKIWDFISGWTSKLHDFSEGIDELQVMIEEETSSMDLGEVYRGK